jgi:hypothetical protein
MVLNIVVLLVTVGGLGYMGKLAMAGHEARQDASGPKVTRDRVDAVERSETNARG